MLKLNTRFAYLPTFTRTPGGSFSSLSEVKVEIRRNSYFFLFPSLTAIAQSATAVYFFLILVATVRPVHNRAVCQRANLAHGLRRVPQDRRIIANLRDGVLAATNRRHIGQTANAFCQITGHSKLSCHLELVEHSIHFISNTARSPAATRHPNDSPETETPLPETISLTETMPSFARETFMSASKEWSTD